MDTSEYTRAKEHHAELVRISEQARSLRPVRKLRPSSFDGLLLITANALISLGQKMKRRVVVYHLTEESL